MRDLTLLVAAYACLVFAQSDTTPVTGILGNATITTDNPAGAVYVATLPNLSDSNIRGSVVAQTNAGDRGISFQVTLDGFSSEGGPFLYHIHEYQVPSDGNCTATGDHLDPFERGESPACDASLPMTCQVGDLSGKHGSINGTAFSADYVDDYVSTTSTNAAFVGNHSIVIHYANLTRITCANFVDYANGTTDTLSTATSTSSSQSGSSSSTSGSGSTKSTTSSSATSSSTSATSTAQSGSAASIRVYTLAAVVFAGIAFFI